MEKNSCACVICQNAAQKIFAQKILCKYDVQYFKCENCAAIFTEKVFWADEAYADALNSMDTGVMQRNWDFSQKVSDLLPCFFEKNQICGLDFAGGYGIMTRLLRDNGFDFYWYDKFAKNLLAKGYEFKKKFADVVCAFEVFEHFTNPIQDLTWISSLKPKLFLFSTLLYENSGGGVS